MPPPPKLIKCGECVYAKPGGAPPPKLECHRKGPTPVQDGGGKWGVGHWPLVDPADECAEGEKK